MSSLNASSFHNGWRILSVLCLCTAIGGNIYAYGIWSESMSKHWEDQHDSQSRISGLYQVALFGNYMPFAGFFYHAFGGRASILAGALMNVFSYLVFYFQFFASDDLRDPNTLTYVAFFILGHSVSYIDTACIGTNLVLFDIHDRGASTGLLKGYFGLSASIITLVHASGATDSQLFMVLGPGNFVMLCIASLFVCDISLINASPVSKVKLDFALALELSIAVIIFFHSIFAAHSIFASQVILFVVIVLLFSTSMTHFVNDTLWHSFVSWLGHDLSRVHAEEDSELALQDDDESISAEEARNIRKSLTVTEALREVSIHCLFAMLAVLMGGGLLLITNAAKIMKAKDVEDATTLVSLLSVSNCFGRIVSGYVADSDFLQHRRIFRPMLLIWATLVMGAAHLLAAYGGANIAYIAGFLGGFAYGASWALNPSTLADIAGLKYFGLIYGLFGLAPMIGSYAFSDFLASYVYKKESNKQEDENECHGNQCFAMAHLIMFASCIMSALLIGPVLVHRTRKLYIVSLEQS